MDDTVLAFLTALALGGCLGVGYLTVSQALKRFRQQEMIQEEKSEEPVSQAKMGAPEPPKPRNEKERLSQREKQLSERQAKVKAEQMKQLREREDVIRRKQEEQAQATQEKPQSEKEELLREKGRIQDMIQKAEQRYASGQLSEQNFKMIIAEYQQQIIDLDVKLRRGE